MYPGFSHHELTKNTSLMAVLALELMDTKWWQFIKRYGIKDSMQWLYPTVKNELMNSGVLKDTRK